MQQDQLIPNKPRAVTISPSWIALFVALVAYPALRGSSLLGGLDPGQDRSQWWAFWLSVALGHWLCFALVALALRREGSAWSSLGLDWRWFVERKGWLLCVLGATLAASVILPGVYYGDSAPGQARLHPLGPVSTLERLFWIFLSVTAGVVEEVLYRGLPFRRLDGVIRSPWVILPITVVSFALIHGTRLANLVLPVVAGVVFGVAFIKMGRRRLEVLILVHALVDMQLALTP